MTNLELEQAIRDYIKITYNAEYTGWLRIVQHTIGFTLELGIPSYMTKTCISSDHETQEEFLEYIKNELKSRNYIRQDVYKVERQKDSRDE